MWLEKVIRNEAMKVDPPEIYSWRVFLLACSVSIPCDKYGLSLSIY